MGDVGADFVANLVIGGDAVQGGQRGAAEAVAVYDDGSQVFRDQTGEPVQVVGGFYAGVRVMCGREGGMAGWRGYALSRSWSSGGRRMSLQPGNVVRATCWTMVLS